MIKPQIEIKAINKAASQIREIQLHLLAFENKTVQSISRFPVLINGYADILLENMEQRR